MKTFFKELINAFFGSNVLYLVNIQPTVMQNFIFHPPKFSGSAPAHKSTVFSVLRQNRKEKALRIK